MCADSALRERGASGRRVRRHRLSAGFGQWRGRQGEWGRGRTRPQASGRWFMVKARMGEMDGVAGGDETGRGGGDVEGWSVEFSSD